jgi:hypothetical protein
MDYLSVVDHPDGEADSARHLTYLRDGESGSLETLEDAGETESGSPARPMLT